MGDQVPLEYDSYCSSPDAAKGNWRTRLLMGTLLVTSFSSLIYEVVWGRELSFVFGTSAFAITAVLTTFMAGLALGSLLGGRIVDKIDKKYQFLAFTEISIGLACLATPQLLRLAKYPYLQIYDALSGNLLLFNSALFALSFMVLIVPTFLIGIAFPTVVRLYHDELKAMGRSVGMTYMFDTLGGAAGALLTGFLLLAAFGLFKVSVMASVLNIALGAIILAAFSGDSSHLHGDAPSPAGGSLPGKDAGAGEQSHLPQRNAILLLFFLSGFAALTFETIWTRYIALIYGSSMQSFSTVLASFLTGLGIGSIIASRYADQVRNKLLWFAFVELLIGITGMLLVVAFPAMERWFLYIYFRVDSYALFMLILFIICFTVILVPTVLMGMTLPLLSSAYASGEKVGTDVGTLYSANSFGSIFGAFTAGFMVIPLMGLEYSSVLAGAVYAAIAFAFFILLRKKMPEKKMMMKKAAILGGAIVFVGFILFLSFYQPDYLYNGVYYHGTQYADENGIFQSYAANDRHVIFKANSPYGVVTVFRDSINVWLKNNGKTDASLLDMDTQGLLSHLPLSIHPDPKKVLDIGMGGGFSLSSILAYDEVRSADIVEIDPEVVEACRTVLAGYNNHALNDTRTRIIVADGRNFVFSTDEKYDVIISEPPNIWVSGVSNLFTEEFYEIARSHLNDGGIFSQWFPGYEMNEKSYMIAIKTLGSVFPYLYEFEIGSDKIVLASAREYNISRDMNRSRLSSRNVDRDFNLTIKYSGRENRFIRNDLDPGKRNYDFLISCYRRGPAEMERYARGADEINKDDLPALEFSAMRNRYLKFRI
ncbi:MAG TPA: fused MFS/spermidine synthase [Methanotrichaceae archaeon]|nr:fused MFS/spermidine synthase [Methanotrichaceae archaeon]